MNYYSVVIPFTIVRPTIWHPTEPSGPFRVITRGAFKTRRQAHAWAARNIPGHRYRLRLYSGAAYPWTAGG